jgi:hypothetical protein
MEQVAAEPAKRSHVLNHRAEVQPPCGYGRADEDRFRPRSLRREGAQDRVGGPDDRDADPLVERSEQQFEHALGPPDDLRIRVDEQVQRARGALDGRPPGHCSAQASSAMRRYKSTSGAVATSGV